MSGMTRKDYLLISRAFVRAMREQFNSTGYRAVIDAVRQLAVSLKRDNPRFEVARFVTACGVADADAAIVVRAVEERLRDIDDVQEEVSR